MKSKARFGTFLGSTFFLFFLSPLIPSLAQSAGDAGVPQTPQSANAADGRPPASADSSKVTETRSFKLEGAKVWVDTGISLEPGQRFRITS